MARIRSIKPEFFRHEGLQEIQASHPELNPMLVFAGLWTLCDKEGRFEWKPRQIKLDVLPFIDFDMDASLSLLSHFSFISRYVHGDKQYGVVVNFKKYQAISGKELQQPARYPEPTSYIEGSTGEVTGKLPDTSLSLLEKEREREREKETVSPSALVDLASLDQPVLVEPIPLFPENQTTQVTVADTQEVKPESLIFAHWKSVMVHPRAVLSDKTRALLKARLKEGFTVESCIAAINGCAKSPHHMGFNDRQTRYDSVELIFRNGEQTNRFIGYDEQMPAFNPERHKLTAAGRKTAGGLDEWLSEPVQGEQYGPEHVVEGEFSTDFE